jgi:hypothetical protein
MNSSNNNNITYSEEEMAKMAEIEKMEDYLETLNERCKKYDKIHLRKQVLKEYKKFKK